METKTAPLPLSGRNYALVGGASGIGFAAARALAERGANVLIVSRSLTRGEQARKELQAAGAGETQLAIGDVSNIVGSLQVAEQIAQWQPTLHGLVHSAMMAVPNRRSTADGFEWCFGLQYMARYVLNRALLARLVASGDGRIVHVGARVPGDFLPVMTDLQFERHPWKLVPALYSSQVLGYLHVQEAVRQWAGLPVTATVACVNMTRTNVFREMSWPIRLLIALVGASADSAAANTVTLLCRENNHDCHGTVLTNPKQFEATPLHYSSVLAHDVWEMTEQLVRERGHDLQLELNCA